ncbi:MAG: hypothetical protein VYA84_18935, partial [Planctomycetota bacterium]|nr:hypothetical protein [Planctomycetota bacterium]
MAGILVFVQLFSLQIVGLHVLMGFVLVGLIALPNPNKVKHLSKYARNKALWLTVAITAGLIR